MTPCCCCGCFLLHTREERTAKQCCLRKCEEREREREREREALKKKKKENEKQCVKREEILYLKYFHYKF